MTFFKFPEISKFTDQIMQINPIIPELRLTDVYTIYKL